MAVRRLAEQQPNNFAFTPENEAWAHEVIARYPEGREASAIIPLLWRAQEQNGGWVSEPAIRVVSDMLDMPYIRGLEVATFYTMFNLHPVGDHQVLVCTTTPCWLRGSDDLIEVCKRRIAETQDTVSADGRFSWMEVECAGACVNAPMAQIGKDYYEDLTPERFEAILDTLARGEIPAPGPQSDRSAAEPADGLTTLTDPSLYVLSGQG
ncbi:MAG: NADH-quinone oxidoreductase subunit NuoE [Alphaproteobacteria bacterium]